MRVILLGLCLCLPLSTPDFLPPGYSAVRHELVLNWDDNVDTRFVFSPSRRNYGYHVITRGKPFPFWKSGYYGPHIFAVPPNAVLPDPKETLRGSPWPCALVPVHEVRSVPIGYPVVRILTTLRVAAMREDGFLLEVVEEERFGMFDLPVGPVWLPLLAIAGVGFLLLLRFNVAIAKRKPWAVGTAPVA